MVVFTLEDPSTGSVDAGDVLIRISAVSDSLLAGNLADSIVVRLNGVELDGVTTGVGLACEFLLTARLIGPQNATLTASASDDDGDFRDSWKLDVTPEGIVSEDEMRVALYVERLLNYFPSWTAARKDDFSIVRQLLNPIAEQLDTVTEGILKTERSRSPMTIDLLQRHHLYSCVVEDADLYYETNSMGGRVYSTPEEVNGVFIDGNKVRLLQKANLTEAVRSLPTRFNRSLRSFRENLVTPARESSDSSQLSIDLMRESPIYITIWNANKLAVRDFTDKENIYSSSLVIKGEDDSGRLVETAIIIQRNETVRLSKQFRYIHDIIFNGADVESSCVIAITINKPRKVQRRDYSSRVIAKVEDREAFATLKQDETGSYIEVGYNQEQLPYSLVSQMNSYDIEEQYILLNEAGGPITASDFDVSETNSLMYVVDAQHLYIYNRRPVLHRGLKARQEEELNENDFAVEKVTDLYRTAVPGEKIATIRCIIGQPRKTKITLRWAWKLVNNTTGTSFSLLGDGEAYEDSWSWRHPARGYSSYGLQQQDEIINLYEPGDYTVILRVQYTDRTEDVVSRLFQLRALTPAAQYRLDVILPDVSFPGVTLSANNELIVWGAGYEATLTPVSDYFVFSSETGEITTLERYENIEVKKDA